MSSLQRPAPPAQNVTLSLEQVKEALGEVLDALQSPTGSARLEEARENSGNDLGKMLQLLLPTAVQIQQEVLQSYGFSPDGEGKSLLVLIEMCHLKEIYHQNAS
ncbi:hypothetical protein GDO81_004099 [Engystomops pustulosus]|uniref:Protein C10 n=1 Tax=Engystomops pustulosus TaxID=76066 RepID=A0AAV6ZQF7_ENGPU|nr:hypothetical protein GDO81_004099 [Engystomops pustulosus]